MERLRVFFETVTGKLVAGGLIALLLVGVFVVTYGTFGPSAAGKMSSERLFICAKTGKTFEYTLKKGDTLPVYSPASGEKTGYPAELCTWTAAGGVRPRGVPVLLNSYRGDSNPTFCPDCGRLVVGHNPPAAAGRTPPPTKDEYKPRRADRD